MPVIPVNLDEVKEMRPVPMGKYAIVVASVDEVKSKKGKDQFDMSIAIEGHDDAPNLRHFVSLPMETDEAKALKFKVLMLKRLCSMFGIPLSGDSIDTSKIAMALVGRKAVAEITMDHETDENGNQKPNGRVFNRLNVPLLDDGASGRVAPPPPRR